MKWSLSQVASEVYRTNTGPDDPMSRHYGFYPGPSYHRAKAMLADNDMTIAQYNQLVRERTTPKAAYFLGLEILDGDSAPIDPLA